jgi:predicted metalloprotease with PDZ domain
MAKTHPAAAAEEAAATGGDRRQAGQAVWMKPAAKRDSSLREKLAEKDLAPHWIYDDLNAALEEARRTGKPLLVLFRCVPCQCAAVLDQEVARVNSGSEALQRRFVCVRVVQMNGVNLDQFQFDRDLSFVALFMNADGAVYGRYGTRATLDRRSMSHISHASFGKAMERALELHRAYPRNQAQLAAKRGAPVGVTFPEAMKHMKQFPFPAELKDCIHCHMAGEARLAQLKEDGRLGLSDVWPFPLPENVGLKLDTDDGLLVKSVVGDSAAAAAGMKPGDQLVAMNGQPLISQGDVQWVLQHLPQEAELQVSFLRNGATESRTLSLTGAWKKADTAWRASLASVRPNAEFRVNLFKSKMGIAPGEMALVVNYPQGVAAQAGLRSGDIVVEVDGRKDFLTEADLLAYIHFHEPRPKKLRLTIARKEQRLELTLPLE